MEAKLKKQRNGLFWIVAILLILLGLAIYSSWRSHDIYADDSAKIAQLTKDNRNITVERDSCYKLADSLQAALTSAKTARDQYHRLYNDCDNHVKAVNDSLRDDLQRRELGWKKYKAKKKKEAEEAKKEDAKKIAALKKDLAQKADDLRKKNRELKAQADSVDNLVTPIHTKKVSISSPKKDLPAPKKRKTVRYTKYGRSKKSHTYTNYGPDKKQP